MTYGRRLGSDPRGRYAATNLEAGGWQGVTP